MKTVVYYTATYFMDTSSEIINVMKSKVNLHVLIEVTPSSRNATIMKIDALPENKILCKPQEIMSAEAYAQIKPYLDGVASVHFVIHNNKSGVSMNTFRIGRTVNKFIRSVKPSVIHLEAFSLRSVGLALFFPFLKKLIIAVHDAKLHSGEATWKSKVPGLFYLKCR